MGESKIVSPAEPESMSVPTHQRRSNKGYSSDVRAGLGSVKLDERAGKTKQTDKKVKKGVKS